MRRLIPPRIPWLATLIGVALFVCGTALGYFYAMHMTGSVVIKSVRGANNLEFTEPILFTEVPESMGLPTYGPLKQTIADAVKKATSGNGVTDVGVYFRDLDQQEWIGVNEADSFAPGSLLKVGLLMGVLRLADTQPSLLTTALPVYFSNDYVDDPQNYFPPKNRIQNGNTYTVNALLTYLIVESDDRAVDVLDNYLGTQQLDKTLADLQVPAATGSVPTDIDSPQQFSRLFRVLYNGSYLPPTLSDQALKLLSMSDYPDGLVAGVSPGTTVAHKFGESFIENAAGVTENELHDCGIVYYPGHPYFLCVMTKGTEDYPALASVIKNISGITWDFMKQKYP